MGKQQCPFSLGFRNNENFCKFLGISIPQSYSPGYFEVFKSFNLTAEEFCEKANSLFGFYRIKVPKDYVVTSPNDFAICVASCILIHEKYNLDVEKILKNELLIKSKEKNQINHAVSLASTALFYLENGCKVEIKKEKEDQYNPDLLINGIDCEVKVLQEPSWISDVNENGQTKEHDLFLDLSYDLGCFLSKENSGYKGIKQADVVLADLSNRSLSWIKKFMEYQNKFPVSCFPEIKRNRIIYFTRKIKEFSGFYIDFQPELWRIIKNNSGKHSFKMFP